MLKSSCRNLRFFKWSGPEFSRSFVETLVVAQIYLTTQKAGCSSCLDKRYGTVQARLKSCATYGNIHNQRLRLVKCLLLFLHNLQQAFSHASILSVAANYRQQMSDDVIFVI